MLEIALSARASRRRPRLGALWLAFLTLGPTRQAQGEEGPAGPPVATPPASPASRRRRWSSRRCPGPHQIGEKGGIIDAP